MERSGTSKQYDRWSKVYDRTFGPLLRHRLRRAIAELDLRAGDRVLDLGVGTGMTLDAYPGSVEVVGMDLSAGMLERARNKVLECGLHHVELVRGDALSPPFAPASFDHLLIAHVLSVVHDPGRLLERTARLLRPGGRAVIVNHFRSERRGVSVLSKLADPLCRRLGWRSDITLERILETCPLKLVSRFKLSRVDLWDIVVLEKAPAGARATPDRPGVAAAPPAASPEPYGRGPARRPRRRSIDVP